MDTTQNKIKCVCGLELLKKNESSHKTSKKHLQAMERLGALATYTASPLPEQLCDIVAKGEDTKEAADAKAGATTPSDDSETTLIIQALHEIYVSLEEFKKIVNQRFDDMAEDIAAIDDDSEGEDDGVAE